VKTINNTPINERSVATTARTQAFLLRTPALGLVDGRRDASEALQRVDGQSRLCGVRCAIGSRTRASERKRVSLPLAPENRDGPKWAPGGPDSGTRMWGRKRSSALSREIWGFGRGFPRLTSLSEVYGRGRLCPHSVRNTRSALPLQIFSASLLPYRARSLFCSSAISPMCWRPGRAGLMYPSRSEPIAMLS